MSTLAKYLEDLTWRCDICGDERRDPLISVHKVDLGPPNLPGIVKLNVKFCNDRVACRRAAESCTRENWKQIRKVRR